MSRPTMPGAPGSVSPPHWGGWRSGCSTQLLHPATPGGPRTLPSRDSRRSGHHVRPPCAWHLSGRHLSGPSPAAQGGVLAIACAGAPGALVSASDSLCRCSNGLLSQLFQHCWCRGSARNQASRRRTCTRLTQSALRHQCGCSPGPSNLRFRHCNLTDPIRQRDGPAL